MGHAALPRARRLTEMLDLLRLKPHSSRELATHFKVGIRTIQRDLEILRENGEALQHINEDQHHIPTMAVPLNAQEALALLATSRMMHVHAPTQQRTHLKSLEKLTGLLPEHLRTTQLQLLATATHTSDTRLQTVLQAWMEQQMLTFEHEHKGKKRKHQIFVLHLDLDPRTLDMWVLGKEVPTHKPSGFLLSQMHKFKTESVLQVEPELFDPSALRTTPWGSHLMGEDLQEVKLIVFSELYRHLQQHTHHWATFSPNHDIHTLTFQVPGRLMEHAVLPWVLSWGAQAHILAPSSLREQHSRALSLVSRDSSIPMTGNIMRLVQHHPGHFSLQELGINLLLGEHHTNLFVQPLLDAQILRLDEAGKLHIEHNPPISSKGSDLESYLDHPPRFGG